MATSINNKKLLIVPLVTVAALAFSAGCETGGGDDNDDDRTAGARTTGSVRTLPAEARIVEEGMGRSDLTYTARDEGRIYVFDETDGRVVYSTPLDDGQRFVL